MGTEKYGGSVIINGVPILMDDAQVRAMMAAGIIVERPRVKMIRPEENAAIKRAAKMIARLTRHYAKQTKNQYGHPWPDDCGKSYIRGIENGVCLGLFIGMDADSRYNVPEVCRRYWRRTEAHYRQQIEIEDYDPRVTM